MPFEPATRVIDPLKILPVLIEARRLLKTSWTQAIFARTANGDPVSEANDAATCWCMMGALQRANGGNVHDDEGAAFLGLSGKSSRRCPRCLPSRS